MSITVFNRRTQQLSLIFKTLYFPQVPGSMPGYSKVVFYLLIGLVGRMFDNGLRDLGSIPGRFIPKTFKMVLDTSLLNTPQYKVRIKSEVEQSRERSSTLLYTLV